MDNQNVEFTTPPPTYNEAVINDPKGRQQYQQIPLQSQNLGLQLSEDTPDIPETRQPFNQYTLGRLPMNIQCPRCQQNIQTKIIGSVCKTTHLISAMMCALGCCCCLWIPYCLNSCKDIKHYCPNCNACVGKSTLISKEEDRGFVIKSF